MALQTPCLRTGPRLLRSVLGVLALLLVPALSRGATSLRFYGNGSGDIDRVKVRVDDPADTNPGPPADVGATDFTLELWMKGSAAENTAAAVVCGANIAWINGNIVVDRDRFNQDRKFGVSIAGGVFVFGVSGDATGDRTICGATNVLDSEWHHVAVERRRSDGWMWLFVDGVLETQADGPDGDVSYPDDGIPGNFCGGPCDNSDPFLVFGAEKHDAGPAFPSFSGWLDEIRISRTQRYSALGFTRPKTPFVTDADTVALYHLDEGMGDAILDSSAFPGGPSEGVRQFGGAPAGPEWWAQGAPLGGAPTLQLQLVTSGLTQPIHMTHAGDGSGRYFIVEQGGYIRIYKNGVGLLPTPFLDIHTLVTTGSEQGLLSVAFHPNYEANGFFYVYYTDLGGTIVIRRYQVSADPDVANPGSGQLILSIAHPTYGNHNGGLVLFGPDNYLYIGTGDGGGGGDPDDNARDLNSLLGKLLRLDVDGGFPYAIPPSNPFVGVPGDDRIWAYGLRNPWRWSFDRVAGDLLLGDVGQDLWEEIDFQPASSTGGENYGWPCKEGFHDFDPTRCGGVLTPPILEYGHGLGCSVTGGFRYRGTTIPSLNGTYIYADYCTARVWTAVQDGQGGWTATEIMDLTFNISSFGEDESGEVYVVSHGGSLYRLVQVPYPTPATASLEPSSAIVGDPDLVLTVRGSGFVYGSIVRWNGLDRPTTFVSAAELRAAIPASDLAFPVGPAAAGPVPVTVFTPAPGGGTSSAQTFNVNTTFLDVPTTHIFEPYIQAIWDAGITTGCDVRLFCPDGLVTRGQMAIFLIRGIFYPVVHIPPPATGMVFADVPTSHFAADYIEEFYSLGITQGCEINPLRYCPDDPVTRAQTAILVLRSMFGFDYIPPDAVGIFADVPVGSFADDFIEDLYNRAITSGCAISPLRYCPGDPITRGSMAVFITRAFNLPLP